MVDGAVSAHDLVIEDLRKFTGDTGPAIDSMLERRKFGLEKYGSILHADNGRDYAKDIDEEVGDLVAYLRIYIEKYPALKPLFGADYLGILQFLCRFRAAIPALREMEENA